MEDASATTYFLVDKDSGWPTYKNGQDFVQKTIVMRPSQCGPLKTIWINDHSLKVICVQCGLSLGSLGKHLTLIGDTAITYENFPDKSFSQQ
jgi:hypothetical protein